METFLIRALQLIMSLSILVLVHEFGHFLFARIFKVRVEKFYLFFDPWFSLFKFKPKNSDTEYGLGWLPLGGYCKIAGMVDESLDMKQMAQPAQPYEFRSKPAWQRLLIMTAGVIFNFLLALFIYSMVLFAWGETYIPLKNMDMGMYYSETAKQIGYHDGDILLSADGEPLERMDENTFRKLVEAQEVTVLRNGEQVRIAVPDDFMQRLMREKQGFVGLRYPMVVQGFPAESPAREAGMQPGDSIVSVNGVPTPADGDVAEQLALNKGKEITVGFYRNGQENSVAFTTDSLGMMGVLLKSPEQLYSTVTKRYGFFESFPAGIRKGVATLKGYVSDMKYVFTKEGASSVGGFGMIGSLFAPHFDWKLFWERTAWISIILAFINILPIPMLDGGHVMFLLYEVVARRKPSDKFLEYAQVAGMVVLFALLIYANGNDIYRFFFH
ncbi:MAG: RIP metalloprotease RseP [Parabacteroides sp.]|nr:RIP metalloprotease RseP [Parabacteroides sp.]